MSERSVFDYQVRWSSALGHTPQGVPDDFGLELGATQFNGAIVPSTPRPFCPVEAESAFWSRIYALRVRPGPPARSIVGSASATATSPAPLDQLSSQGGRRGER